MNGTRTLPMATEQIQRLTRHAWLDLKQARVDDDLNGMLRAERRMNALLDQLAKRNLTAAS